jgi:hypothetical protein
MSNDAKLFGRRDRHAQGLRGPLIPHSAPSHETGTELFERLLTEAVADLTIRLGSDLINIEILMEEIPNLRDLTLAQDSVPLGRVEKGNPSKVVIYQRPIESRITNKIELDRKIRDVLAELIGLIIGLRPIDVDPNYFGDN